MLSDANGVKTNLTDTDFQLTIVYPVIHVASTFRLYGDENPNFTYRVTGATLRGEPMLTSTALMSSAVGEYQINAERGNIKNAYYEVERGTLTVEKTPLTIKAGTYTKKQGDALPEFTLTYDGFKNNETSVVLTKQPVVSCEATETSAPGEYIVTVRGAEAMNYSISYIGGKLIVTEADPVTITAKSYTREYGDVNPTFEYDVEGAALSGNPEITCEAVATSPVGIYPIIIKKGGVKNYNDSYVNGTLTIEQATLTASVANCSREVGHENPIFEITYSGWKNNEDENILITKPTASTIATKESPLGEYPITVSGGEAQNYTFNYINGTLTITEPSGIYELIVGDSPVNIFTTAGVLVRSRATSFLDLQKGVYVVRSVDGKYQRKVAVR